MTKVRGIDGGGGRSDTDVDNLDDEDTVVGVPDFVRPQTDEANAPRLFDEAVVEVALGQIVETESAAVAVPPPQAVMSHPHPGPTTVPLPTVAPPRRFSTTAPMPTVAPRPPIEPTPAAIPAVPAVPMTAPIPRSLPSAADVEGRSTRVAILLFALISIVCGGVGLGWFLLAGHRDEPTIQPPPAAPPTRRVMPRHAVAGPHGHREIGSASSAVAIR